jgi:hypothetical protein
MYDQALDQIAERAMRTVVEINVTSYSVPEHGQDGDTQNLRRERALGSGSASIRTATSSPTTMWLPARCAFA